VHGEVLVGAERIQIDGRGAHRHRAGPDAWRAVLTGTPHGVNEVLHRAPVLIVTPDGRRHHVERSVCRGSGDGIAWAGWEVSVV
jgi:hypothetical protein